MRRLFGALAAIMSLSGIATETVAAPAEAAQERRIAKQPVQVRIQRQNKRASTGGAHEVRYRKQGFLDQKSKRQKLRNNPHFRRSKKCTTKIK